MHNFAFLLKTYSNDLQYTERLLLSFNRFNVEGIPLYIVAPKADGLLFEKFVSPNIFLLSDEDVATEFATEDIFGIRPGYINQEIIKLCFWETGLTANYFCLDSDGEFLKEFRTSDFMYNTTTPYTILVEDNELKVEPEYYEKFWKTRYEFIKDIQNFIGLEEPRFLTCHGFTTLNNDVLKSLKSKLMNKKGLTYLDLLRISPYEFSWYNMWLQYDKTIPIVFREPMFKCFHHKNHHLEYLLKNVTRSDIARGYIGIVVNSNYSRDMGLISIGDDRTRILSSYFTFSDMMNVFRFKLWNKFVRIGKILLKMTKN